MTSVVTFRKLSLHFLFLNADWSVSEEVKRKEEVAKNKVTTLRITNTYNCSNTILANGSEKKAIK
jgi:hypothetical protein